MTTIITIALIFGCCIIGVGGVFLFKKIKQRPDTDEPREICTQKIVITRYVKAKYVAAKKRRLNKFHRSQHKIVADFGVNTDSARAGKVNLFYGTDRSQTGALTIRSFYGSRSSNELSLGHCEISIPQSHKAGELERPYLAFFENPKKHICLLSLQVLGQEEYFSRMRELIFADEEGILIFVHGFNTTFHDAALRTAQFAYDLKFKGRPFFYSWPSLGSPSPSGYLKDLDSVVNARPTFERFIRAIKEKLNPPKVYIIGHSMGNVLIAEFIKSLREEENIFTHIVLAAPDIDKNVFTNLVLPNFKLATKKSTLYTCGKDFALYTSKFARHKEPRLGHSGEGVYVADSLDTVDASDLSMGLGTHHTYFAQESPILDDIVMVLNDLPPSKRRLVETTTAKGSYWSFPR
jgi:esterase/lipase superfamily enzyme